MDHFCGQFDARLSVIVDKRIIGSGVGNHNGFRLAVFNDLSKLLHRLFGILFVAEDIQSLADTAAGNGLIRDFGFLHDRIKCFGDRFRLHRVVVHEKENISGTFSDPSLIFLEFGNDLFDIFRSESGFHDVGTGGKVQTVFIKMADTMEAAAGAEIGTVQGVNIIPVREFFGIHGHAVSHGGADSRSVCLRKRHIPDRGKVTAHEAEAAVFDCVSTVVDIHDQTPLKPNLPGFIILFGSSCFLMPSRTGIAGP